MTPEDTFEAFKEFCYTQTRTQVLLASEDEELVFQRLTLAESVSKEFGDDAIRAFADGEELDLVKYEAGYKPADNELCYLPVDDSELVKKVVDSIIECASNFNAVELFKEKDDVIDNLRFYVVIVKGHSASGSTRHALFLRTFSRRNELTRSGWKGIMQSGDFYNKVTKKIFMFDEESDCLVWRDHVFIKNLTQFERIFQYFEALQKTARQTIASVSVHLPISNLNDFKQACLGNPLMLSKLAQIAKKPYLASVTMNDIKRTIKDFALQIEITPDDELVFDPSPSKRWLILKLLGDDYLGSTMTKLKYASTSKIQL
jgi:hypothetical protein